MERRYQSQLQNMKDRLEQSDSKNRSLQNYVHFLKTSYGNMYADSLHTSWFKSVPICRFLVDCILKWPTVFIFRKTFSLPELYF